MTEGALDPSAYAQVDGPGIGGARLAAIEVSDTNIDLITFEDPEANFSSTLGGTAVVAPLEPLVAEPGTETNPYASRQEREYVVQEGDTIGKIARDANVSENTVRWRNGLAANDTLRVGDRLIILPITGVSHKVKDGDTLYDLAKYYDANVKDIMEYNRLDSDKLSLGKVLIIPDGAMPTPRAPQLQPSHSVADPTEPAPPGIVADGPGMLRPVDGYVSQPFGRYGHSGVDLAGNGGHAFHAALDGTVDFSGWRAGYGKAAIINHGNGLKTLYGHASALYVASGQTVKKGDTLGSVGSTGRSTGSHLHYEVVVNGVHNNPCKFVSC